MRSSWVSDFLNWGSLLQSSDDTFWIGWGKPERRVRNNPALHCAYAPDFFLKDELPWLCFPQHSSLTRAELIQALESFSGEHPDISWEAAPAELFRTAFLDLRNRFASGDLVKAVPFVFERATVEMTPALRATWLEHLLKYTRSFPVFPYGIWTDDEGMLGATPELLFCLNPGPRPGSQVLETAAVAGTRPRGSERISLLEDAKELREHRLVVDGIRESLEPFGRVRIEATRELELPTLSHLLTPIQVELEPNRFEGDLTEIVRALHPTPALGAHPREAGQRWLSSYEQRIPRGRFGAPFAVATPDGGLKCVVSIRNLQWKNRSGNDLAELRLGAGCGVIIESQLEREWAEIQTKLHSIKRLLGV